MYGPSPARWPRPRSLHPDLDLFRAYLRDPVFPAVRAGIRAVRGREEDRLSPVGVSTTAELADLVVQRMRRAQELAVLGDEEGRAHGRLDAVGVAHRLRQVDDVALARVLDDLRGLQ